MRPLQLREEAKKMRLQGRTYEEIRRNLRVSVPKSTLSCWLRDLAMPAESSNKIKNRNEANLRRGREIASLNRKRRNALREEKFHSDNNLVRALLTKNVQVRKIALSMLYLGEGSKTDRGSLMFGNSNPDTVRLFLSLLRSCFQISNEKLRLTLQCRADQNVSALETFWSSVTGVPLKNFYKAQVDQRSIGKPTRKKDYKGVCRIDYFSSDVDLELKYLAAHIEKISIS